MWWFLTLETAATQWLFNFMITRVTPQMINNIGWKVFLVFGSLCFGMSVFTFFFMKETKGLTLEDMDVLFGGVQGTNQIEPKDIEEHKEVEKTGNYDVIGGLSPVETRRPAAEDGKGKA